MNEQLQKSLATAIEKAIAGLEQGKDFVIEQAPDLIQQLLMWKFWEAISWVAIQTVFVVSLLIISSIAVKSIRHGIKLEQEKKNSYQDPGFPYMFGGSLVLVASLVPAMITLFDCLVPNILTAVKISIAPKVYLIEWAASQIK